MNRIPLASPRLRHFAIFFNYLLTLVLLVLAASAGFAAPGRSGVDAILLMDSSGSMAKNDPHKLRIPAAKLFMSLLGQDDRVGLISFSDNGYPVLHLTAPGPQQNARILASADQVSSRGVYTNLYAALAKGAEMLDKEGQPGQEKMLVLMSDGKMDVGNTDEDWRLTQQLQGELLNTLSDKHIKVYTIAFTESSDVALLQDVARKSGALFELARTDADLHEVFSDIFETAKSPDMLPIDGGKFTVDASIDEVTIVASKEREDVRIFLQSPEGSKLSSDNAGDKLKWFVSEHFDMITLPAPQAGTWKLLFSGGRNRAYIVTNMTLNHNPQQPNLDAGEDMVLESWLEQDGKLLDKEAVLTNTRFTLKIQGPDGDVDIPLYDTGQYGDSKAADGVYSNTLSYEHPGAYRMDIVAEGETFKRQKTVHFEIAAPAPGLKPPAPEPAAAEPDAQPPASPQASPEQTASPAQPATPAEQPSVAVPPQPKKASKLGVAVGIFVGVNLLLGLIGFGVWWLLKKRKAKAAEPEQEEDADEI